MKILSFLVSLILLNDLVQAAEYETVMICKPKQQEFLLVRIQDKKMQIDQVVNGGFVSSNQMPITKTLPLTKDDLTPVTKQNGIRSELVGGTNYGLDEGAVAIAKDAKNNSYVFAVGLGVDFLGDSKSCSLSKATCEKLQASHESRITALQKEESNYSKEALSLKIYELNSDAGLFNNACPKVQFRALE